MNTRGRLVSGLVTIVMALAGFVTACALPAAAAPGTVRYVALGDSYAAGVGAGSYDGTSCMRSSNGYPAQLVRESIRIALQANAACSGWKIAQVADNLPSNDQIGNARLVTLTVGGNDLGFADLAGPCLASTLKPEECLAAIDNAVALDRLSDLRSALTGLYAQVAFKAPAARIVVTGYPFLFEPPADGDAAITARIINRFREATALLNDTIEQAVAATNDADVNIHYVDVTEAFAEHGLIIDGSVIKCPNPDAFIHGLFINCDPRRQDPEAFHPTAEGYGAYADAISAALPGGWLDKS